LATTPDREIVIRRTLDAPRGLVFDAWTDPHHVAHWWGPDGFTITTHEMTVAPGGVWRLLPHRSGRPDHPRDNLRLQGVGPERRVYRHSGEDDADPARFQTTVTFAARGGRTELTMRAVFESNAARDFVIKSFGAIEGGKQTITRLAAYVARLHGGGQI